MAIDFSKFKSSPEDASKFNVAPYDAQAGRKKMVARLERALKQFNKEAGQQGKDFEVGYHGQIRFKPTLAGHRIGIESADEPFFATSDAQFPGLIAALKEAVQAGEYDEQIEAALTAPVASPAAGSARKSSSGSTAKFATLRSVKQAATRLSNGGKSDEDIRTDLTTKGARQDWIEAAIANLKR